MYRIAAMGDRDSVYGFGTLGIDVVAVSDSEQAAHSLRQLASGKYAIIYITESLAAELEAEIDKISDREIPAVIPIPGIKGNNGIGIKNLKKAVEKAVGSDIIFND